MSCNNRITTRMNCDPHIVYFTIPILTLLINVTIFIQYLFFTISNYIIGIQMKISSNSIHTHFCSMDFVYIYEQILLHMQSSLSLTLLLSFSLLKNSARILFFLFNIAFQFESHYLKCFKKFY